MSNPNHEVNGSEMSNLLQQMKEMGLQMISLLEKRNSDPKPSPSQLKIINTELHSLMQKTAELNKRCIELENKK